ncbi:MAG: hypothetical protein ACRDJB_09915 [Actinomycetota bacterium]
MQPERVEHLSGPFDIIVKLSTGSDGDLDWLNDLPGVEAFVRLEATS